MEQFTQPILKARIKSGLTQKQLAKKANVMQCTISRYEAGAQAITLETAMKLARALNDKDVIALISNYVINFFADNFKSYTEL